MSSSPTLQTIPLEILEHIALYVATEQLKGPPTDLISLCVTSRVSSDSLALSRNPTLYASIFRFKFDFAALNRRFEVEDISVSCLAEELSRRFGTLRRLRLGLGCHASLSDISHRENDLRTAITMYLENDGKNSMQLMDYGKIDSWLQTYFVEANGGSYVRHDMSFDRWPRDTYDNRLALWLLYLCHADDVTPPHEYAKILRAYSISAHRYPLSHFIWTNFSDSCVMNTSNKPAFQYFNRLIHPTPPPISLSTILGYLAHLKDYEVDQSRPFTRVDVRSAPIGSSFSMRWELDWERWQGPEVKTAGGMVAPLRYHLPGTIEGAWEGIFSYTEFGVYAAVLSGESPHIIHEGAIGHNSQTWKIREYNLYSSSDNELVSDLQILKTGPPHNAFFPESTFIEEKDDQAILLHSSQRTVYNRLKRQTKGVSQGILRDVILLGEGHSTWGQFTLKGRIRAADAMVIILKEYGGNNHGTWLYRGYLAGGRFVGRWRDTMTPTTMIGYEGGFDLFRRTLGCNVS